MPISITTLPSGLNIWTYGTISLANVTANGNGQGKVFGGGAYLDNCEYNDLNANQCDATLPRAITLIGNNTFNNNFTYGLVVNSLGAITVNNVNANNNGEEGMGLWNSFPGAVGGVSVNNTPTYLPSFNNNGGHGLQIYSGGAIAIMDLDAQNNGLDGVYLNNRVGTGTVSLGTARANWSNWLNNNHLSGLEVYSKGTVTLANINAKYNGYYDSIALISYGYGAYVDNTYSTTAVGITLNGNNVFNGNHAGGLYLHSNGAILANAVTANNNSGGKGASFMNNANPATPQTVTLTGSGNGNGNFDNNGNTGLFVQSFGLVTLNNVEADTNTGNGIQVDNATGATASLLKGITILGYANVNKNTGTGLSLTSLGAITVNSLNSDKNNIGAVLDNYIGNPGTGVTFTGNIVTSNSIHEGMDVLSRGPSPLTSPMPISATTALTAGI